MPTNNPRSRSALINNFASAWNRREELRCDIARVNEELTEITNEILNDDVLTKALTDTGVRIGEDQVMGYEYELRNTTQPLSIAKQRVPPYPFQLDEVSDDE